MPTTNAPAAKLALINLVKAQTGPGLLLDAAVLGLPGGETIDVRYAYQGQVGPYCIYGGGWRMEASDAVAEGPGLLVNELATVSLYARVVARPACDVEETDAVATKMSTALGSVLRANPKLAGQLSIVGIASGQGDYSTTDDETISIQAFQVLITSRVTWG